MPLLRRTPLGSERDRRVRVPAADRVRVEFSAVMGNPVVRRDAALGGPLGSGRLERPGRIAAPSYVNDLRGGVELSPQDGRAAVEKACELLTAFGDAGDTAVGVTELARLAGLTKSTAHRQLSILLRANMIERSGRGYRTGRKLRSLARAISDDRNARMADSLLPYLVELFEVTRHTAQLAILDGIDVIYVGKVSGHRSVPGPSRIGTRLPAHGTAGGKLLLAHHPCAAADVLASPLRRLTPHTVGSHAQLKVELDEIRRRGVAIDCGGAAIDVSCVASAVVSSSGEAIAAMSVCAPAGSNVIAVGDILGRIASAASRHLARTCGRS